MRRTTTGRGNRDKKRIPRQERKVILIVCEKNNRTERIYFKQFRNRNTAVNIDIPHTKVTKPGKLVEFAIEKSNRAEYDSTWCVFDVDDTNTNNDIRQAKKLADRHNIQIALSNPSFEFWYLLHYVDYRKILTNPELINELHRFLPNYSKTDESIFYTIQPGQNCAVSRANKINDYHIANGNEIYSRESNPSTQVHKLVVDIMKKTDVS